jgi:hypothetical protein
MNHRCYRCKRPLPQQAGPTCTACSSIVTVRCGLRDGRYKTCPSCGGTKVMVNNKPCEACEDWEAGS